MSVVCFQSLREDTANYKRVLENLTKKSQELVPTDTGPQLAKDVTALADRYVTLASTTDVCNHLHVRLESCKK